MKNFHKIFDWKIGKLPEARSAREDMNLISGILCGMRSMKNFDRQFYFSSGKAGADRESKNRRRKTAVKLTAVQKVL